MYAAAVHPERLRRDLLSADPAAPWVTYHDLDAGGRIELSRTTFANWVAKAAGLLADEYDVEPGECIAVDMDLHWLLPVWCFAAWSLGAAVQPGTAPQKCAVAVVDSTAQTRGGSVTLASPSDLWGQPLGEATPAGTEDAVAELRGYPDHRADPIPDARSFVLRSPGADLTGSDALTDAARLLGDSTAPVLVSGRPGTAEQFVVANLCGPAAGGSTVLVRAPEDAALDRIAAQEHVGGIFPLQPNAT